MRNELVRMISPVGALAAAVLLTVVGYQLAGGAPVRSVGGGSASAAPGPVGAFGESYSFAELEVVESALYYIDSRYVEPERVDFGRMFDAALDAVEQTTPTCLFTRPEPGVVRVAVGKHTEDVSIPEIDDKVTLQTALGLVSAVVEAHLEPQDLGSSEATLVSLEYTMINGMLGTLDPHSVFLPPEDSREMDVENEGEFGGLGITIVDRDGRLTIEYPLKDTPAEREGLQPDDHIVRIDGESTINMTLSDAVRRLRGPVGAPVVIHVAREGLPEPLVVRIVRARIRLNPVEGKLLDDGVAYVSIKSFHSAVADDLAELLADLESERPLRGLVLDLRGNPGGFLKQAVRVSDYFLKSGMIVSTIEAHGVERDREEASAEGTERDYPMVVLMDASSASASEIVAGALRNNDRALIVGERSFGKGSVQTLHSFADDSKLKITMATYLTPGPQSIQSVGIPADIELVPSIVERDDEGEPRVRMFWRERVRREGDLDKHLVADLERNEASFRLRFLRPFDLGRRGPDLDLDRIYEVQFARDVIAAAPQTAGRRELLVSAAAVVAKHEARAERALEDAFADIGLDWAVGEAREAAELDVTLDVGGEAIIPGARHVATLTVTNRGDETLHQLAAVSEQSEVLGQREWFFGRLEPGQSRTFSHPVHLVEGYPSERNTVVFAFRDSGGPVALHDAVVDVEGRELPRLSWAWSLTEADGADGDGALEVGEPAHLEMTIRNDGLGVTGGAVARLANRSGKALDLSVGRLPIGTRRTAAGEACEEGPDCMERLLPGETWTGTFDLTLRDAPSDGSYALDLAIVDEGAYDFATVVRGGFGRYFEQSEEIRFERDQHVETTEFRVPPSIEFTERPEVEVTSVQPVRIAGTARDDVGIAHVQIFAGGEKVHFDARSEVSLSKEVPFQVDVPLAEGANTIAVLVTDVDGFTRTRSIVTRRTAPASE